MITSAAEDQSLRPEGCCLLLLLTSPHLSCWVCRRELQRHSRYFVVGGERKTDVLKPTTNYLNVKQVKVKMSGRYSHLFKFTCSHWDLMVQISKVAFICNLE